MNRNIIGSCKALKYIVVARENTWREAEYKVYGARYRIKNFMEIFFHSVEWI